MPLTGDLAAALECRANGDATACVDVPGGEHAVSLCDPALLHDLLCGRLVLAGQFCWFGSHITKAPDQSA